MSFQICSCKGLDSNCKMCFGSGYVNTPTTEKPSNQKDKKSEDKRKLKNLTDLPLNIIDSLGKTELINLTMEVIALLDLKSKKQMQILNSIPFSSNTFRRDFKEKFASLKDMEDEKVLLRDKLTNIEKVLVEQKISGNFKFKHYLSDIEIDVDSNRHLKDLIKEYKRLKN